MRTKTCELCSQSVGIAFRVQIEKGQDWIFVCKPCCENTKNKDGYRYGGTWKGARHVPRKSKKTHSNQVRKDNPK